MEAFGRTPPTKLILVKLLVDRFQIVLIISYEYEFDLGNHLSPVGVGGGGWKDPRADQGSVMGEYKTLAGGGGVGGIIRILRGPR